MSNDPQRYDPPPDDSSAWYGPDQDSGSEADYYDSFDQDLYDPPPPFVSDDGTVQAAATPPPSSGSFWSSSGFRLLVGILAIAAVVILVVRGCGGFGAPGAGKRTPTPDVARVIETQAAATETAVSYPTSTPAPPTPTIVIPTPTPISIQVGMRAKVANTDGAGMRFRSGPGTRYITVAILDEGTVLKVVGGPETDESLTWWRLQADDGTVGWGAADFLEPAGE